MILGDIWQVQEKPVSKKTKTERQKQVLRVCAYETNASLANLICTISKGRGWKLARNTSPIMYTALFHFPLFDKYFEIKVKNNRPEYFKGRISSISTGRNDLWGIKAFRSVTFILLLVYVSPDRPAMKAVASGHDGSLQGCPKNVKLKIWTVL